MDSKLFEFFNKKNSFNEDVLHKNIRNYSVITEVQQLAEMVQRVKQFDRVIGVDAEWSVAKNLMCLLQIGAQSGTCVTDLLALQTSREETVRHLKALFECTDIVKVFYAGRNDLVWLWREYGIIVCNYFDVQEAAVRLDARADNSLIVLWEKYCPPPQTKTADSRRNEETFYFASKEQKKRLQLSDWSQRPLTQEQLDYSALDCHFLPLLRYKLISELYLQKKDIDLLQFLREMQVIVQKTIFQEEERLTKCLWEQRFAKLWQKRFQIDGCDPDNKLQEAQKSRFVELCMQASQENLPDEGAQLKFFEESLSKVGEQLQKQEVRGSRDEYQRRKLERRAQQLPLIVCKKPVYANHQILAPDGFHLCNCDEKKINWYLKKELADVVQQNPPYWVIRLKFLPGGKSMEQLRSEINQFEHGFYMEERANRCCVCGTPKHYLKYHIIPLLYRRHFPQTYKSHRSHDVVLVCPDCHQRANMASDQLKTQIARQYNLEMVYFDEAKRQSDAIALLAAFARSLWKNQALMPPSTLEQQKNTLREQYENVQKFIGNDKLPQGMAWPQFDPTNKNFVDFCNELEKQKKLTKASSNKEFKNQHGRLIVEKIVSQQPQNTTVYPELEDFIRMWRRNFFEVMQPKFLPDTWSIEHKFSREFGEHSRFSDKSAQSKGPKQ